MNTKLVEASLFDQKTPNMKHLATVVDTLPTHETVLETAPLSTVWPHENALHAFLGVLIANVCGNEQGIALATESLSELLEDSPQTSLSAFPYISPGSGSLLNRKNEHSRQASYS